MKHNHNHDNAPGAELQLGLQPVEVRRSERCRGCGYVSWFDNWNFKFRVLFLFAESFLFLDEEQ